MIKFTINGKTLREWLRFNLRKKFVKAEVKPCQILVCWRDCDEMVYGWTVSADSEFDLIKIAMLIQEAKQKKLVNIVNGKEENFNEKASQG